MSINSEIIESSHHTIPLLEEVDESKENSNIEKTQLNKKCTASIVDLVRKND